MPTRDDYIKQWNEAAQSGTLLTAKHDPNNLSLTFSRYRSVLTQQMSGSLQTFIEGGDYDVEHYDDAKYPGSAGTFVVSPRSGSGVAVVGSLPSGSLLPLTGTLDRLVVVSGSGDGWHTYAATSGSIQQGVVDGRFTLKDSF